MKFSVKEVKQLGFAVFAVSALAAVILSPSSPRAFGTPQGDGEKIFKTQCSVCHGLDGSGSTPMGQKMKAPDLRSSAVQKQSDGQLTETIKRGKGNMPSFEKRLDEGKITQVVAHVRTLVQKN